MNPVDPDFAKRAKEKKGGMIVAGSNYGQGSSREHAALVPLYLGIKAVIAKSFARIHRDNLINSGILPLVFENENDYDTIEMTDILAIENARAQIENEKITVKNVTKNTEFTVILSITDRQRTFLKAGGVLNSLKSE
jgi:aconitate hydratase